MGPFLSNLGIVATSPLAFVAYIFVLLAWVYVKVTAHRLSTNKRTAFSEGLPEGATPEHFLTHTRLWIFFWLFIAILIAIVMIFSLNLSAQSDHSKLPEDKLISKAKAFTENYLTSLTEETFDARDYYAPLTEKFFNKTNMTHEKINEYITNIYYKNYLSRHVSTVPGSWKVIDVSDGISTLSFNMKGNWLDAKTRKPMEAKSRILIKLNKDFKFTYFSEDKIFNYAPANVENH